MARLVNYGPGDVADRLCILALKIHHGQAAGKAVEHFIIEHDTLLAGWKWTIGAVGVDMLVNLGAVNAALWQATDHLRRVEHAGSSVEAGYLAFRILRWNDRRAALIEEINALAGIAKGPEKL